MVTYLQTCACRGRRPKGVSSAPYYSRKELLARLMRKRQSPAFLVAPNLSGKTTLALEYAESIFSFERVYWLDGTSPCFLRDLDSGDLAALFIGSDESPGLIVIDDLPYIGAARVDKAAQLFNELSELGWELLITMVPACDVFGAKVMNAHRIRATDLLLDKGEVDLFRSKTECAKKPATHFSPIERMPGVFWQPNNDLVTAIKNASTKECLSPDALLVYFVLLVLREGSFEDIDLFVKGKGSRILETDLKEYLYLGLDFCQERFLCHAFSIETISAVFSTLLSDLTEYSRFNGKGSLVLRLADALLGKGESARACSLVQVMAAPAQRCAWLDNRSEHLLSAGCFLAPHKVHTSLKLSEGSCRYRLLLAQGWRLFFLDQREKAAAVGSRIMRIDGIDDCYILDAAFLILRSQTSEHLLSGAYAVLERIVSYGDDPLTDCRSILVREAIPADLLSCKIRALIELCLRDYPHKSMSLIRECQESKVGAHEITQLLTRVMEHYGKEMIFHEEQEERCHSRAAQHATEVSYAHLEELKEVDDLGFPEADLLAAIARCANSSLGDMREPDIAWLHEWAHVYELDLATQRTTLAQHLEVRAIKREEYYRTHPDELRNYVPQSLLPSNPVPHLSVRLFGGLEAVVGDRVVDPKFFSRQTVKNLFAVLVVNQGKEVSRDKIAEILWPESGRDQARSNLYSIWSLLRKALRTPEGTCPYLIRTQFSYKLDAAHLSSDIADFTALCRKFLFGNPDIAEWTRAFTQVNDLYTGDFMPTEMSNEVIVQTRETYRAQLVDAFSMAALRLCEIGEYHMALWFSQVAVSHDPTREDAYSLLMRAQSSLGQRTAALDTYFKCRRYLSEELGIDPSSNTNALYQEIISEDPGDFPIRINAHEEEGERVVTSL